MASRTSIQGNTSSRLWTAPPKRSPKSPLGENREESTELGRTGPQTPRICTCKHDVRNDHEDSEPEDLDEDNRYREDHEDQEDDSPINDSYDDWDEEATLIALVLGEGNEPEPEDKTSVADRIQPAFEAYNRKEQQQIKDIIVPVITKVKHVHDIVEKQIDPALIRGLRTFDRSSKTFEDHTRRESDRAKEVYTKTKNDLDNLFLQLEASYAEADQLFENLEAKINPLVQFIRDCADSVPGAVERKISQLEKENKAEFGTENQEKIKEKLLRSILEKY
ncbi:hypothetical protein BJ138DRAFT_1152225 [Hygrophoropsis aurantiaca]|uniref:Uncharacterized protein n=1 Tax=Hygrophoropsis aurantiaca TaxID=72124 RepID=A0ACB8ACJ1_9AGAM|nr:hypothetical protein BJ138DRAFT_1152225 [Hygrophoropsis aurantiaca]